MIDTAAVRALQKIPLFKNLNHANLKRIASLARVHEAPQGSLIFKKQTSGNHLFIVLSGKIKIYSEAVSAQRRKTFAYLEAGSFFGEMTLLDRKGHSLTACALQDSRLMTISKQEFKRLILNDPRFAYSILETLIERLRQANEEIESQAFRSLYGRVCKKILELMAGKGNASLRAETVMPMPITHVELAELTGTAREIVTKILSSLRRQKIISYEGHRIKVISPTKLQSLAQENLN
ncbi:MAG: Crp/Fnr family transcriptional regulator [Elusimicrobiota bacterium]